MNAIHYIQKNRDDHDATVRLLLEEYPDYCCQLCGKVFTTIIVSRNEYNRLEHARLTSLKLRECFHKCMQIRQYSYLSSSSCHGISLSHLLYCL